MEKEKCYLFEFTKDTLVSALTWHSTCYTGSVEYLAPAGMRAYLDKQMNSEADFYFSPIRGSYPSSWISEVQAKAKEESRAPQRYHGGLSFFVSIFTLLSDNVRFLPTDDTPDIQEPLQLLQEALERAKQCAAVEETELFKTRVEKELCDYQIDEDTRKKLLGL